MILQSRPHALVSVDTGSPVTNYLVGQETSSDASFSGLQVPGSPSE